MSKKIPTTAVVSAKTFNFAPTQNLNGVATGSSNRFGTAATNCFIGVAMSHMPSLADHVVVNDEGKLTLPVGKVYNIPAIALKKAKKQ